MFLFGIMVPITIFLVMQLFNDPEIFFATLMRSLGMGSTYAIVALGFVLIFKATQTVNFAQGALAVSGALFLSFAVADDHIPFTTIDNPINSLPGPDWFHWGVSLVLAMVFAAILGLVIERLTIRPMVGQPLFSVAVITLGLEIALRVFNNDTVKVEFRNVEVPWGIDGFHVGKETINYSIIAAMVTAAIAFVAVFIFYRSRLGIAMRAVAFDQEAAMAQGINVGRVFAVSLSTASDCFTGGWVANTPPIMASTAPAAQAMANTRPTLMPWAMAASWSKATARIAMPRRLR